MKQKHSSILEIHFLSITKHIFVPDVYCQQCGGVTNALTDNKGYYLCMNGHIFSEDGKTSFCTTGIEKEIYNVICDSLKYDKRSLLSLV